MKDVVDKISRGKRSGEFQEKLLALLNQNGPLKGQEIALQLGTTLPRIRSAIKTQREHFLKGKTRIRIVTGPEGYTLSQTRRNVVHETSLRIGQIAGNIFHGSPVFLRCRKIATKDFAQIQIRYQPKMINFQKLLT